MSLPINVPSATNREHDRRSIASTSSKEERNGSYVLSSPEYHMALIDYSAGHSVFSFKRDQRADEVGPRKAMVLRLTGKSIYEWTMQGLTVTELPFWYRITHVLIDCLMLESDGSIVTGYPHFVSNISLDDAVQNSILMNMETYMEILTALQNKYPHIRFMWSMPSVRDSTYWAVFVRRHGAKIVTTLNELIERYKKLINGLVAETSFLFNLTMPLVEKITLNCWWIYLFDDTPNSFISDLYFESNCNIDYFIVNSFGMLKKHALPTSHGLNEWLEINPEASVKGFKDLVEKYRKILNHLADEDMFLMGMATTALQYTHHPWHLKEATFFSVIPNHQLHKDMYIGDAPYEEKVDREEGYSLMKFSRPRKTISYDNTMVRELKFEVVQNDGFAGLVMGHPENDLLYKHPGSLLYQAMEYFKPMRPPVSEPES